MIQKSKRKVKVKVLAGTPFLLSQQQLIGKGMFGSVVKAYNRQDPSQQLVAKVISLQNSGLDESIKAEIQLLKQLPMHPNLVNTKKIQISTENNFYLIMQYCNQGSFQSYIIKNKNISQMEIWERIKQFCKGYQILYDNNLIHRDIKPDNILMHNGQIKIADFGLARKVQDVQVKQNLSSKGTPIYMAPQLQFKKQGSSKIDVFSFGIVIFRLAYRGQFPFGTDFKTAQQYFQTLMNTNLKFPKFPKRSQQLVDLISKMMQKDPERRISWPEIFDHPKIKINQFIHQNSLQNSSKSSENSSDDQFQRLKQSLNVLQTRNSIAQVKIIDEKVNFRQSIANQTLQLIQFEQTISKQLLKSFQKTIFKGKVLLVVIQHTNKKIQKLKKKQMHNHVKTRLNNISKFGYKFCLEVLILLQFQLKKLTQKTEGNNSGVNSILQMIKKHCNKYIKILKQDYNQEQKLGVSVKSVKDEYPSQLYDFLTQYSQYPSQIKNPLKVIASLLTDIYDASMKFISAQYESQQATSLDSICLNEAKKLNDYLLAKQSVNLDQINNELRKVGLLFI